MIGQADRKKFPAHPVSFYLFTFILAPFILSFFALFQPAMSKSVLRFSDLPSAYSSNSFSVGEVFF